MQIIENNFTLRPLLPLTKIQAYPQPSSRVEFPANPEAPLFGWSIAEVLNRIENDNQFVGWALVGLYIHQTPEERAGETTTVDNSEGFTVANASKMGGMAQNLLRGGQLSVGDLEHCRGHLKNGLPRLGKYRNQLLRFLESGRDLALMAANRRLEIQ